MAAFTQYEILIDGRNDQRSEVKLIPSLSGRSQARAGERVRGREQRHDALDLCGAVVPSGLERRPGSELCAGGAAGGEGGSPREVSTGAGTRLYHHGVSRRLRLAGAVLGARVLRRPLCASWWGLLLGRENGTGGALLGWFMNGTHA